MFKRNVRVLAAAAVGIATGASGWRDQRQLYRDCHQLDNIPGSDVNGQLVTGTFGTQFTACQILPPEAGAECFVPQMRVTFNIAGTAYSYGIAAYGTRNHRATAHRSAGKGAA